MDLRRRVESRCCWIALVLAVTLSRGVNVFAQWPAANVAQQLVFAGLRSVGAQGQIHAVSLDAAGDIYLAFDQGDGVRVLKVANDGGALLAQVQIGAAGDSAAALSVDAGGNVYVTGTSTSGALTATQGAAVSSAAAGTTSSFVAKFDGNLNELFLSFTGGTRIAASSVAASSDRVLVAGITYGTDLPVTANAIQQVPATGSLQNGFVEAFSADGTALEYATYVTGAEGDTTPTAVAVDAYDDAWLVGSTTATGFPTVAAVVPAMLSTPSGFLLQLTPAGDEIVYSTFVPGAGLTSVALDSAGSNLLISGQVALGQFPVDTVESPLVATEYQVLLRMPLNGTSVESGTVIAPGMASVVTAASGGAAWVGGSFTPGTAPLLPQGSLSPIGNGYAVRVTPGMGIDETVRFGGLANFDQTYASVPVAVNGLGVDGTGALFAGGAAQPTASSSLLATETYDFPLRGTPTSALPSTIANAEISSSLCGGSLCAGSAGYLAKVDLVDAGPSLAFSAGGAPMVTLRNPGSISAEGLQVSISAGTLTTNCGSELAPGGECDVLLAGGGSGSLSAATTNGGSTSVAFGSYSAGAATSGLAFVPKELDFGIQTSASAAALKTITISNLGTTPATFSEGIPATPKSSSPFSEVSSTCPLAGNTTQKILAGGTTCTVTVGFSAYSGAANDGFVQASWAIGPGEVLLTGYSQSANLSLSAAEVDFGTQFQGGLALPRYLYLSNASASTQAHTTIGAPVDSPFLIKDGCPGSLLPQTVCRMEIDYDSNIAPSSDSLTVTLDQGLSVLLTGQTMPAQSVGGSTLTPSVTVSPTTETFSAPVVVTGVSSVTQTVSVTNSATTATPLGIAISGDFSDVTSCGSTLAAGATCAIAIVFTPSQPGVRQGLLTVASGAGASPAMVALIGTGTVILAGDNGSLSLGETPVGQPVVQFYKVTQSFSSLSLQTTGPYTVTLVEDAGFGHGSPPSSAFVASGSGTCYNCWLGVEFQPTAVGEQDGTVGFSSATKGLPYVLQVSGAGIAASGLIMSPAVENLGTAPVGSVSGAALLTLTNLVAAGTSVAISGVTTSGDFAFAAADPSGQGCAGALAYAASCSLWVQFAPTEIGARSGTVTISTSAGTATVSLAGSGTASSGISISPLALTFLTLAGDTGPTQTVSVENTGTQGISIGTPTTTTTNFTAVSGCGALAAGASCSITVRFVPGAAPVSDTLSIPVTTTANGGSGTTQTFSVGLSGAFTILSQGLAVFPGTMSFGPVATSTIGSARQVTVTNLSSDQVSISVTLPRSYELEQNGCTTVAPNASCVLNVAFVPLENGDLPGTILVAASSSDGSVSQTALLYADGFGVGSGALSVSGGLIVDGVFNFGSVATGETASKQFTLSNTGAQPITVRRILSQSPFLSSTTCGNTLPSGGACSVTVEYSPGGGSSGMDTGALTVESEAASSPNVLDLEGQAGGSSGGGGSGGVATYSLSQSTLSFSSTTVGDTSAPQTVVLTNTGSSPLQVSSVSTTADFLVQNGCGVVTAGGTCTLAVASAPQAAGIKVAALEIRSDAADSLEYVTLVGTGAASPLSFSPTSLTFGSVLVGGSSTLPVQVTNSGTTAITFTSITAVGPFAVSGECPVAGETLAPLASCTEQVMFQPTSAGQSGANISFNTSASTGAIPFPVSGTGAQAELIAIPTSLAFGTAAVGNTSTLTLVLSNLGTTPITGLTLSVTGGFVVAVPCGVATLAPGQTCPIQVAFSPTTAGVQTGSLVVTSSDPGSPLTIPLTGMGVANGGFALTVNGSATATGTVTSGNFVTFSLLVTSSGGFSGSVALTCAAAQTVSYASCALVPSQVNLGVGTAASTVTINTEQSNAGVGLLKGEPRKGHGGAVLAFLLPGAVLMFRRRRARLRWVTQGLVLGAILAALQFSGCGGGGGSTIATRVENDTPPGQYQFQIAASSTSGVPLTQTVTVNLVVTSP